MYVPHVAQEAPGWEGLFAVSPGLAIWSVATFLVLLGVLRRFAWRPMLAALDAREHRIQEAIDDAQRQRQEADTLLTQYREQLAEGRRQAQAVVAESRAAADRLRKELEEKARRDSQAMLESARREIERERDAAIEVLRRESVDLAMAAVARLLKENPDGERDRRLIQGYIDRIHASETPWS